MTEHKLTEEAPEEGSLADVTRVPQNHRPLPKFLALVWILFFLWMAAYVTWYLIPALPKS